MTASPNPQRKRVLSGMRSTGKLHLGNYVGALENWVRMQDEHECFFCVADWHALTTDYADTSQVKQNSLDVLLDWLAAGLDPKRCTMFIQSHVPQHAELHLLLSMITPLRSQIFIVSPSTAARPSLGNAPLLETRRGVGHPELGSVSAIY